MKEDEPYGRLDEPEFSLEDDYTKWLEEEPKDRRISVGIDLEIFKDRDTGLFEFLCDYLTLEKSESVDLNVCVRHLAESQSVGVTAQGKTFDGLKAETVLQRLQTARTFLFHSSTDPRAPYRRRFRGILRDISEDYKGQLERSKIPLNRVLKRIAREQQHELEELLGRLSDKYRVGLSLPSFDPSYFPYDITLGDRQLEVSIDDWGSGTRNRTLVLLTVFRAKQVAESSVSASKVTPIIVIEEPESFLHPLAQAEFGRVLQDLAQEFEVQLIVTTHSPYLLSQSRPDSNILLERRIVRGLSRHTERVDTSGDRWMEPFAVALGITDEAFRPWKELFFHSTDGLLLVEGDIDKEYFELLRLPVHGDNQLRFNGDVFAYGGRDTLKQQALLRFIKNRFTRVFVTFDLDAEAALVPPLQALGFERRKSYMAIGQDEAGKRAIEGLLPERIRTAVYAENPNLAQALAGTSEERRQASQRLKRRYLDKFRSEAVPGEDYAQFYTLVRIINKGLGGGA